MPEQERSTKVIALLTSFNRVAHTVECLSRLYAAALKNGVELSIILVDDGSSDGTAQKVGHAFPDVEIISGHENLFWCRGMHLAQARAEVRDADFLLWVNDDTHIFQDAFGVVFAAYHSTRIEGCAGPIVVGATCDKDSGVTTYSGCVSKGTLRRFQFRQIFESGKVTACDSMNGNFVLIPMDVARKIGNLDPAFEHALGDLDYGLRAKKSGIQVVVASEYIGTCSRNPIVGTYRDTNLALHKRLRMLFSRKGLPTRSWLGFTRKHGGVLWPLYFSFPYLKLLAQMVGNELVRPRTRNRF